MMYALGSDVECDTEVVGPCATVPLQLVPECEKSVLPWEQHTYFRLQHVLPPSCRQQEATPKCELQNELASTDGPPEVTRG